MIRIENYLGSTKEEIENRRFNIWIGISLGNKYFTKEHIRAYLEWALAHTKEDVLVVISDVLHAINIEVLDNKNHTSALRRAIKLGDAKYSEVQEIISVMPQAEQNKVKIVRWSDLVSTERYQYNLQIIKNEYIQNRDFREYIHDIVRNSRQDRIEKISSLNEQELDRLSEYVLNEIPLFIGGTQMGNTLYTLIPYPGLTKLDELFVGLQDKALFPEIAEKLRIPNKIAILDAYVS